MWLFPAEKKTNKNFALFSIFEILKTLNERHVFYTVDYDNNGELFEKKKQKGIWQCENLQYCNGWDRFEFKWESNVMVMMMMIMAAMVMAVMMMMMMMVDALWRKLSSWLFVGCMFFFC